MSKAKNMSPAQMIDSFLRRVALGVAVVGVMYGMSALEAVLPPAEAGYADTAQLVLSILVVLLIFPAFVKFMLARKRGVCKSAEDNSYIAQMFRQAAHHAFSATFITLIILQGVTKALKPALPVHFFIDLALFISLAFFAAVFFKLTGPDDEDDEWEDEAP